MEISQGKRLFEKKAADIILAYQSFNINKLQKNKFPNPYSPFSKYLTSLTGLLLYFVLYMANIFENALRVLCSLYLQDVNNISECYIKFKGTNQGCSH